MITQLTTGTCAEPSSYAAEWDFAYDGDGVRTATLTTQYVDGLPQPVEVTQYYFGGMYEVTNGAIRKYYSFGGSTVAMKDAEGLKYLLTDHLGSVVAVTDDAGTLLSQQRYLPFGEVRQDVGEITQTDFGYTSQRALGEMGLMDYKARMYSSALMRFSQPDNMVPDAMNPQAWNHYAYVLNSPLRYTDPTGNRACGDGEENDCSGHRQDPLENPHPPKSLKPHEPKNPKDDLLKTLNDLAIATQDIATTIDAGFSLIELALAAGGCIASSEIGCVEGAAGGLLLGQAIFNVFGGNAAETGFSTASLIFTAAADLLDDGELGETTTTSLLTFGAGGLMLDPIGDLAIDGYASGYNHGIFNDIKTFFGGGSLFH